MTLFGTTLKFRLFRSGAAAIGALLLAVPGPAAAEEIFLLNGDRLTGRVAAIDERALSVDTGFGVVAVPRDKLLRVVFSRAGETRAAVAGTIDALLERIRACPHPIVVDGRDTRGGALAEELRLKRMLRDPGATDPTAFRENYLTRSAAGRLIKVKIGEREVNLVDWLDKPESPLAVPVAAPPERAPRHLRAGGSGR